MITKTIHRIKFRILCVISLISESIGITSKSSNIFGTFEGEEFIFYSDYFPQRYSSLCVLDIGANLGDWAETFLKSVEIHETKIYAVEPIPEFYDRIALKSNPKIYAINIALGDGNEQIQIAKIGSGATSFPITNQLYTESTKEFRWHKVRLMPGDDLLDELKIKPDLIKIDTDGYDFSVLKSLNNTLINYQPIIQFEFTHRFAKNAQYSLQDTLKFLRMRNYVIFVVSSNGELKKIRIPYLEVLNHQTKNFIAFPKKNLKFRPFPHTSA